MIRLWEIPVLGLIIAITAIHANLYNNNKTIGPLFHFWWGFVYAVPCFFLAWQSNQWWLLAIFICERFIFYNPILNYLRKPRRSFFFIVAKNSKPGFWDKIEVWWKGFYPWIWGLSILLFIYFNTFL